MPENINGIENREGAENGVEGDFPIRETNGDSRMKMISPSALPHFHGLTLEDLNTFLFDFSILCKTYEYTSNDQSLKFSHPPSMMQPCTGS